MSITSPFPSTEATLHYFPGDLDPMQLSLSTNCMYFLIDSGYVVNEVHSCMAIRYIDQSCAVTRACAS